MLEAGSEGSFSRVVVVITGSYRASCAFKEYKLTLALCNSRSYKGRVLGIKIVICHSMGTTEPRVL